MAIARAVLRAALSDAERWGEVSRNVARLVDPPRVPRPEPLVLTPPQVQAVLAACGDGQLGRLATVATLSGIRQGELLGLRWEDVDLATTSLRVTGSLQRVRGTIARAEPKTRRSRRTVRLPTPAADALAVERTRQAAAQLAAGPRWRPIVPGLVFTTAKGTPLEPWWVTKTFQTAIRRAGLPKLRWHHLRHVYGSLLLGVRVDLATVSAALGHANVSLTASTYAGILPSLRDDAADRLERLLAPAQ